MLSEQKFNTLTNKAALEKIAEKGGVAFEKIAEKGGAAFEKIAEKKSSFEPFLCKH